MGFWSFRHLGVGSAAGPFIDFRGLVMGDFITAIVAKISDVVKWFSDLFISFFVAIWDVIMDAFSWVVEQFLTIASGSITAIDVSALTGSHAWGSAPAEVMNILALLGVGQAVTIITAAIGIRLALQLIPFVRLGS
jgi:hypothetical protein